MPHAEAMHTAMHAGDLLDWTARDWTIHMEEEEHALFPALRAVGADEASIAELEADHAFYRPLLKGQTGPSVELPRGGLPHSIDAHGALEDDLILAFASKLLARAGATVGASSPFGDVGSYTADIENYSGELKDAGEQAKAQSEAQGKKDFRKYAAALGAGDYADAVYDFGVKLSNLIYGSEYERANSDDQKARLTSDVAKIVGMGYPPAGLVSYADFGARDVADRIEEEFAVMNAIDSASKQEISKQIGEAAIYTAAIRSSDAAKRVLSIFKTFSNPKASTIGTMWFPPNAPTYLVDRVPMKPGDRPEIDYVAAAASGLYGAPLEDALKTAYLALNTYASRRGLTNRGDFLGAGYPHSEGLAKIAAAHGQSPDDVSRWFSDNAGGDAMADAWRALQQRYDCRYRKGGCSSSSTLLKVGLALGGIGALVFIVRALL